MAAANLTSANDPTNGPGQDTITVPTNLTGQTTSSGDGSKTADGDAQSHDKARGNKPIPTRLAHRRAKVVRIICHRAPRKDDLQKQQQRQISGEQRVKLFENFFASMIAIATIGASITFTVIVSELEDPKSVSRLKIVDESTVRILLATSWLLFVLVLAAGGLLASQLALNRTEAVKGLSRLYKSEPDPAKRSNDRAVQNSWRYKEGLASSVMCALTIAAFMCLSLAVAAYVEVVDFISFGFTAVFAIGVIVFVVHNLPLLDPCRKEKEKEKEKEQKEDHQGDKNV